MADETSRIDQPRAIPALDDQGQMCFGIEMASKRPVYVVAKQREVGARGWQAQCTFRRVADPENSIISMGAGVR